MLLTKLTKRLCPLIGLALAFSCGKKINDPQETESTNQTDHQDLPNMLVLDVQDVAAQKLYVIPDDGVAYLPTKLIVRNGDATGKRVRIVYNIDSNNDFEFQCFYQSNNQILELKFDFCEYQDGTFMTGDPEDLIDRSFMIDKGKSIKIDLLTPSTDSLKIDAIYSVDWADKA